MALEVERGVSLVTRNIVTGRILGRHLDMWLVVLEAECERLADLLSLIRIEHQHLPFIREAFDLEARLLPDKRGLGHLTRIATGLASLFIRLHGRL